METEFKEVYYEKLTFIYLETPKFKKELHELETHFDKWLYLLRNLNKLTNRPLELQERIFQRFFDLAEIAKYNPQQIHEYRKSLKQMRDYYNTMETAKEDAREEGLEKGLEIGKKERDFEIAKNLVALGISTKQIINATGLTIEEIDKLRL